MTGRQGARRASACSALQRLPDLLSGRQAAPWLAGPPRSLHPPRPLLTGVQSSRGNSSSRPQRQRKKSRLLQEYLTDDEEALGEPTRGRRAFEY